MAKSPNEVPETRVGGLPRSGTGYLTALVEENFCVKVNQRGLNKHTAWGPLPRSVVWVSRNPYAWLASYHRLLCIRGDASGTTLGQWMRRTLRKAAGIMFEAPTNPVVYYNLGQRAFLDWEPGGKIYHVRYEDLLLDFPAAMEGIRRHFGWKTWPGFPMNVLTEAGPRNYLHGKKVGECYWERDPWPRREFYEKRMYMEQYDEDDLRYIDGLLDVEVMERLGYG